MASMEASGSGGGADGGDDASLASQMDFMEVDATVMQDDEGEMLIEDDGEELGANYLEDDGSLEDGEDDGTFASLARVEEQMRTGPGAPFKRAVGEDDAAATSTAHTDSVYCCAFSTTGDALTGGGDDAAYLHYGAASGTFAKSVKLEGHTDSVTCCGFSGSGLIAATGSYDGTVKLWDVGTAKLSRTLDGPGDVEWLAWHPFGDVVLCGANDGTCWMWLATSGSCMRVFSGHDGAVLSGAFTCDGKSIFTGSSDGSARVWAPKRGVCKHAFLPHPGGPPPAKSIVMSQGALAAIAVHPSNPDIAAAAAEDGSAVVVHCKTKRVLARLEHAVQQKVVRDDGEDDDPPYSVVALAFANEPPTWLATCGVDGFLRVWDFEKAPDRPRVSLAHNTAVVCCAWFPKAPKLVSNSADLTVKIWDARDGACLRVFHGHTDVPLALALHFPEGGETECAILSAGDDNAAKVFLLPRSAV